VATERTVLVRLKADAGPFVRGMGLAAAAVQGLRHEINTTNDRTAWLAQSILALGPALVPLGAAAVPIFTGLATQMTFAGVAAGTLGLAFNGIGDALTALNNYKIDPTDAHLKKLDQTLDKIGPNGEHLVKVLDGMRPALGKLANTARAGLFPGVEEGLTSLMSMLPQVRHLIRTTAQTIGDLAADAGKGLSGPRFEEFFRFLQTDAKQTLTEMGHTVGNFVDGLAALVVDFAPLSREMSTGFEGLSKSFADWAHGLDQTAGFQEFIQYIQDAGPRALDLLGSMAGAIIALLHAAAPVGSILLPVFSHFFDILAEIVDSPIGSVFLTAAAAASIYGRAMAIAEATTGKFFTSLAPGAAAMRKNSTEALKNIPTFRQWGNTMLHAVHSQEQLNNYFSTGAKKAIESREAVKGFTKALVPAAAGTALFATAATGLDKQLGLTNTTSLALMGLMVGPWTAALGAGVGAVLDLKDSLSGLETAIRAAQEATDTGSIDQMTAAMAALTKQQDDLMNGVSTGSDLRRWWAGVTGATDLARDAQFRLNQELDYQSGHIGGIASLLQTSMKPALRQTATALDIAARDGQDFADTLKGIDAALTGTDAVLAYRQGILDVSKAIKDNGATVDKHTQKGLDNLRSIQSLAHDIVTVLNTMPFGPDRAKFLDAALTQITTLANKMDSSGRLAKQLRDELGFADQSPDITPTVGRHKRRLKHDVNDVYDFLAKEFHSHPVGPNVELDDRKARRQARQLVRYINSLGASIDPNSITPPPGSGDGTSPIFPADGITVPGPRYPYRDRIPALLSSTEEVVSNRYGQADRWRPFLKAINANMLADGGTIGARMTSAGWVPAAAPTVMAGEGIDYDRLAAAMSAVRPMYGDAHFHGDWTAWRRQMEDDRRATGLDRVPRGAR
jgi:hypothetical protein